MFEYSLAIQGPDSEGAVLAAIRRTAQELRFDRVRAAFAYASVGGSQLLGWNMEVDADWQPAEKRWLVSFDWGHTDPRALEYLASLPNSLVRIPRAEEVLSRRLIPAVCFHPKTLIFDQTATRGAPPAGLVVGSGNLTVSGLQTGYENAAAAVWTPGRLSRDATEQLQAMRAQARAFDAIWRNATPLTETLLQQYRDRRRRRPAVDQDASRDVKTFERRYSVVNFDQGAVLATARAFWIEVEYVVPNLGRGRPGNQIDLTRGSRVFFGLSGRRVARNTFLGDVSIRYRGSEYTHAMRYGNNHMDKLNLPVPGDEGPPHYEDTTLLFERDRRGRFTMTVGTPAQIRRWKGASRRQRTLFEMRSGRQYGVFS